MKNSITYLTAANNHSQNVKNYIMDIWRENGCVVYVCHDENNNIISCNGSVFMVPPCSY